VSNTILHQILDRSDFSPRTKTKYKLIIDRWLDFAGDHPSRWTRERVQAWYDMLVASGVKVQSANVYIASLRYVSRWYASHENNPALDFAVVQMKRGRDIEDDGAARALTQEEIEALLATCAADEPADLRDRTLIVTGLETGMRRMSLEAMTFECLGDNDYPFARVPIKGTGGRGRFDIPLSDLTVFTLDKWMAWLQAHKVKRGPLFLKFAASGKPTHVMSSAAIYHMISKRSKVAGIDHVHPHLLRHTFITSRTIAGLSVFQIASITGHEVPGMGAATKYIDTRTMADLARNSTPAWFNELVRKQVGA
jgi:integrase